MIFPKIKKNILSIFFVFLLIAFLINFKLFLDYNFFSPFEEDIFSIYDYRLNNDLSGWRFNTGVGQTFLAGDPSFHSWSIINLFFQLPIDNKIIIYHIIYLILLAYCSFSIYLLINLASQNLNQLTKVLISSIFFLASFKNEFFYLMQWMMIASGVSISSIILFKYFKSKKNNFILIYSLNLFIIFNLGGAIAVQQNFFYSIIFSFLYFIYFKKNIFFIKDFLKIIFLSKIILFITSLWIFYPTIYYSLSGEYERSSHYFEISSILDFKQFFADVFNILFGNIYNNKDILFPDKNLTPNYGWFSNLPLIINIFFLSLFLKYKKNFWEFLSVYSLMIYTIHAIVSNFFISYGSLNTIFISVYPWSKVYIEIFVIQILLISLVISGNSFNFNWFIKVYKNTINIFLSLMLIIILDSYTNQHITNIFLNIFESFKYDLFKVENKLIAEILTEYFNRFKSVKDSDLLFYYIGSIVILFFYQKKFFDLKNYKFFLLILIIITTFFHSKHFAPLQKNEYAWDIKGLKSFLKKTDRSIFVNEVNKYNLNLSNINSIKFNDWISRNNINRPNYYGYRSPPINSFSRVTSFNSKKIQDLIFDKKDMTLNYRSLQYPNVSNLNTVLLNNLSINLIISGNNLKENFPNKMSEFDILFEDKVYLFNLIDSLPYLYFPKKLIVENSEKFLKEKINPDYAYIERQNLHLVNKEYSGQANAIINKIKNGKININYKSDNVNFLVISDLYDDKWKILINGEHGKIYKTNLFFKGVELPPGDYSVELYYDNTTFRLSIIVSIITLLILITYIIKNLKNEKNN